jgi:hypothetical protein
MLGGVKLVVTVAIGSPAVLNPAFARHSGHKSIGASGGSGFLQLGQVRLASIDNVLLPVTEEIHGKGCPKS